MSSNEHVPVLLGPVIDGLGIRENGCYVDATFGRGGHSSELLQRLGSDGRLIGIDRDPEAIAAAPTSLLADPRFELVRGECAQLEAIVDERGLVGSVDGILLDLGVSSPQLDEARRGFSFMRDGPLDMRMDPDSGTSARDWLAAVDERTLIHVLRKYGEETHARKYARVIMERRDKSPIETTFDLASAITDTVYPRQTRSKKHPATKTFQAIRIVVNAELEQLEAVLEQSVTILRQGGRLCVISFHSLEDRIVKRFMRDESKEPEQYRGMPNIPQEFLPKLRGIGKAISASAKEIQENRRSRSSRLRVAERT